MKIEEKVTMESPAFELQYVDFNVSRDTYISWESLKSSQVGTVFESEVPQGSCGRGVFRESAKIVYKDNDGCAILFEAWGTEDTPEGAPWEREPIMKWFQFRA